MDRSDLWLSLSLLLGPTYLAYGLEDQDTGNGFSPALNNTFRLYLSTHGYDTSVLDYDVPADQAFCVEKLAEALAYDYLLPRMAATPDFSVDAPLTNIKQSSVYGNFRKARDDAWAIARGCGYAPFADNVGALRLNLDFKEPSGTCGSEY